MKFGYLLPISAGLLYLLWRGSEVQQGINKITYRITNVRFQLPLTFVVQLEINNTSTLPINIDTLYIDLFLSDVKGDKLATITQRNIKLPTGISRIDVNVNALPLLDVNTITKIIDSVKTKKVDIVANIQIQALGVLINDIQKINLM
jgi:hypothetical protein